jgi:hypothetical protein
VATTAVIIFKLDVAVLLLAGGRVVVFGIAVLVVLGVTEGWTEIGAVDGTVVGAMVDGATELGATVDGGAVVGNSVDGARVLGANVDGATVGTVEGAKVDGATLDGTIEGSKVDGGTVDGEAVDGEIVEGAAVGAKVSVATTI